MPDNPIYQFLKENNLTQKDEATFTKEYADPQKAQQLYSFFKDNGLTQKDSATFYDSYFKSANTGFDSKEVQQQAPANVPTPDNGMDIPHQNATIQTLRSAQQRMNEPVQPTVPYMTSPNTFATFSLDDNQGEERKKTFQSAIDNGIQSLADQWGKPKEDVQDVVNKFPTVNDAQHLQQLAQLKSDNPYLYNRTAATSTWQSALLGNIRQQAPDQYNEVASQIQQMQKGGIGTSFTDAQNNLKYTTQLIRQYVQDPKQQEQALQALKEDAAFNYNGEVTGTDEVLSSDPDAAFLNKPEKLALQFLKDTGDQSYYGFKNNIGVNPATIQQKMADGKPDLAAIGYSEQKAKLASIGSDLQLRAANEHIASLLHADNMTPELDAEYLKWNKVKEDAEALQDRIHNPNDKTYGYAAQFELDNVAQELIGQKAGFLQIQGNEFRNNTNAPILSVIELGNELFNGNENHKRMTRLAILGASAKDEAHNYVTQANQPMRQFKVQLPEDLRDKINELKENKTLTDDQKREQVKGILAIDNRWYKQPVDPKFNLRAMATYGISDAINGLASFMLNEAATGGAGNISKGKKALATFANVLTSDFSKHYADNLKNNESAPALKALKNAGISALVFAGGDVTGAIDKVLGNTAAADVIKGMTTEERLALAAKVPSNYARWGKAILEGQEGTLHMTALGTGAGIANDAANGELKSPEDYGRQGLLMYITNLPITGLGVFSKQSELKENDKQAWYSIADKPQEHLQATEDMQSKGLISPAQADLIKANIQKAADVHNNTSYTYDNGKVMDDDAKAKLLLTRIQQGNLKEESKKNNSDKVTAQIEKKEAVTNEVANLIHENADAEDLAKRQASLEKKLEAKDEEGDSKLSDKEQEEYKIKIEAIKQYTSEAPKVKGEPENISQPIELSTEKSKLDKTVKDGSNNNGGNGSDISKDATAQEINAGNTINGHPAGQAASIGQVPESNERQPTEEEGSAITGLNQEVQPTEEAKQEVKQPTIAEMQQVNDIHKELTAEYLKKHKELVKQGLRGNELENHPELVAIKAQMAKIENYFSNEPSNTGTTSQPESPLPTETTLPKGQVHQSGVLQDVGDAGRTDAGTSASNVDSNKMPFDEFKDKAMDMAVNMKDSGFDWRFNWTDISQKEREKGVADIKAGKDTAAARKVSQRIQDMYDNGTITVNRGRGNNAETATFTFEHWFGDPSEQIKVAESLPDLATTIAKSEGITADNIEQFKHLFDGFPYEPSDYEALKAHLAGQDGRIEPTTPSSEQSKDSTGQTTPDATESKPQESTPQEPDSNQVAGSEPTKPTEPKPKPSIGKYEAKARKIADKIKATDVDLPDFLKVTVDTKGASKSGVTAEGLKQALADAVIATGKALDKGIELKEAIKEAVKDLVAMQGKDNEDNILKGFEGYYRQHFMDDEATKEEASNGGNTVGVSHDNLNALAKKLGLPEIPRGTRLTPEEYADRGRKLLEAGADVDKLTADFKGGKQPTADDISVARAHLEDLTKAADTVGRDKGFDSNEYKDAQNVANAFAREVVKPMGTAISEPFTALQGSRDIDTGSFTTVKQQVEELTGKPVSKEQQAKIEQLTTENAELRKQAADLEKKVIAETNKHIGEKKEKGSFEKTFKKAADTFRKLKTKPFTFKDENGNEIPFETQGFTWNDLVEAGAKAIEATGKIADGVAAIIDKVKDTDWYKNLSDNDKTAFEKKLTDQYLTDQKDSPEVKELKRLQAKKEKLENGDAQQKGEKPKLNFTPEQQQEYDQLKNDIWDAEERLGLHPSKSEKPLTEEEQKQSNEVAIADIQKQFANKSSKDKQFTPDEAATLWNYAKKSYMDKGISYADAIQHVADDTGLTFFQVAAAFETPKTKPISDAMWVKQQALNRSKLKVKDFIDKQNQNPILRVVQSITKYPKSIATALHGHIFAGTHYPMGFVTPSQWGIYFRGIGKAWKAAYGKEANYAKEVKALTGDKNYLRAKRAGLQNDVEDTHTDDFEKGSKLFGALGRTGIKGFLGIKWTRQMMFNDYFDRLPANEQTDATAKVVAQLVNLATGASNLKIPAALQELTFSANMEAARWGKIFRSPTKAAAASARILASMAKGETVAPEDKVFLKVWGSRVGQQLGTLIAVLGANAFVQSKLNPSNPVNLTDPTKSDYLKLKVDNTDVDLSGGVLGIKQFLTAVGTYAVNDKSYKQEIGDIGGKIIGYGRGKLSPFYGIAADATLGTDFGGNTVPFRDKKVTAGRHKLGWGEWLLQKSPIFIADAAENMYTSAEQNGIKKSHTDEIVNGVIGSLISTGVGIHTRDSYKIPTPFNEQDKKDPTFKFFLDKGMQLPNVSLSATPITDTKAGTSLSVADYSPEIQEQYQQAHKEALKSTLEKYQSYKTVFVTPLKDAFGNDKSSVSINVPKKGNYKEVAIDKLNKAQLAQVLSLAQKEATSMAKYKVFHIK